MRTLLVGAGKACIDPTPDMLPMGTRFGVCEAIYDSCFCRAIAIDNGERKVILLTYDLSDQPTLPEFEKQITDALGVQAQIVVSVTHNHSSPCDDHFGEEPEWLTAGREKYKEIELSAGIAACCDALASMRPAQYGFGEYRSNINTNRDLQTPFGTWVEGRNLDGFSDKTLAMLKFVDMDGKLIAAILNHGTHATNIYLMKDFDGKTKLSGNFPGIACRFVEEHFGNDAIVMWTSGAAGNQNPLLSHGMQYEYPDGYSTAVPYPDGVGYMQMEFMGRTHGADAVKGLDTITKYSVNMPIHYARKDVLLPAQKRKETSDKPFSFNVAGNVLHSGLRKEPFEAPQPFVRPEMVDDPENPVPMIMQVLVLGYVAIVCAGAELYAEIGRDIKAASPYRNTFVITHTKDYRHVGYVVDRSSAHKEVFQAFARVKPGASDELIVESELELFDQLAE